MQWLVLPAPAFPRPANRHMLIGGRSSVGLAITHLVRQHPSVHPIVSLGRPVGGRFGV